MCDIRLNFIEHLLVLCCIISSAILVLKKWSDLLKDSAVSHGRMVRMTDYTLCIETDKCELSPCLGDL